MLFLASLLGGVGVLVLHLTVGLGGPQTNELFDDGVYNALMFGAAFAVIAREITVKAQRAAWLAMGAGLLCWCLGELYFTLFLEGAGDDRRRHLPRRRAVSGDVPVHVRRADAARRARTCASCGSACGWTG